MIVVQVSSSEHPRNNVRQSNRGDHAGNHRYENMLVDESHQQIVPKEQVEHLMRENKEIRRQIADVKN